MNPSAQHDKGVMKYYAELEKTIEEAAKAAKAEPVQQHLPQIQSRKV